MPHVESLSLFKTEETQDEGEIFSTLGLTSIHASQSQIVHQDVSMTDSLTTVPAQNLQDSTLPSREPTGNEQLLVIPINPLPPPTESSIMPEATRSTIGLRSTVKLSSKLASDNTGGSSTIVPNPVLFSKEDEQDGDEEMPLIDIDSDSEDEGTD